jgi:hypothetical protein
MGWDCISELQPPVGLFFIPQVIMSMANHGGIVLTGENWFVHQSALWQSYQQSHLVANLEEVGEENDEFGFQSVFLHT